MFEEVEIMYCANWIQISLPREERRDANKLYNPMTIAELSDLVPAVPWLKYINIVLAPHHVVTEDERVIVDVPDYFGKLVTLLEQTPKRWLSFIFSLMKRHLKSYLAISIRYFYILLVVYCYLFVFLRLHWHELSANIIRLETKSCRISYHKLTV